MAAQTYDIITVGGGIAGSILPRAMGGAWSKSPGLGIGNILQGPGAGRSNGSLEHQRGPWIWASIIS